MILAVLIQAAQPAAPATAIDPGAKMVCKTVTTTGSRLGGKRTCLPKREWDRLHDQTRKDIGDMQDTFSQKPASEAGPR